MSDGRTERDNTYIIREDKGKIHTPFTSGLKRYELPEFDFILNPTLHISNNNKYGLYNDTSVDAITYKEILSFVNSDKKGIRDARADFSLTINRIKYNSSTTALTVEEKIMGFIKAHTIIKYFHIKKDEIKDARDKSLDVYLAKLQNTNSDKEYFEMLQKMFST